MKAKRTATISSQHITLLLFCQFAMNSRRNGNRKIKLDFENDFEKIV